MDTTKKRTFMDAIIDLFDSIAKQYGIEENQKAVSFKGKALNFKIATLGSADKLQQKPKVGLYKDPQKTILVFWDRKGAPGNVDDDKIRETFYLISSEVELSPEETEKGISKKFDIRFVAEQGIDPTHLSAGIAGDVLKQAHDMLKNTKTYMRTLR